jgi:outer membrane usher protein
LPALILGILATGSRTAAAAALDPAPGGANPVTFDPSFIPGGTAGKVDLSRFEQAGYVPPGIYHGDIIVNNAWRARSNIVFATVPGTQTTQPCYDAIMLASYGIDLGKVASDVLHPSLKAIPVGTFCGHIGDYIPDAAATFDPNDQSLSFSVPQLYMSRNARGYVDPSQWDEGINAAVLSYNSNLYRSDMQSHSRTTGYLGLNGSLNFGTWHIRHMGSVNWSQGLGEHYQGSATYLQHDIPQWRTQLIAGDTFTPGDMFDSVRLRGMRVYTDPQMLPQSLRGYAPVVHGLAETNAHVVVRQNGYVIYDTTVAPGPFVIDDLYPTGYGGDLGVEITEADGRVRRFTQPYSAVPQLLREGQQLWSMAVGQISQLGMKDTPTIAQFTYQRGLSNLITGYGGATLGASYQSLLGGAALNTALGAFSSDITFASNRLPSRAATGGGSLRVAYNRNFAEIGTNLAVAAYRYATPGFVGLGDFAALRMAAGLGNENLVMRPRNRMDINLSQSLGDEFGQLYVSGSWRNYWNNRGSQVDFSAGYSNRWKLLSYSLSVQRTRDTMSYLTQSQALVDRIPGSLDGYFTSAPQNTIRDTRVFLNFTIPLGRSHTGPTFTGSVSRSSNQGDNSLVSLNGSVGADRRFTYYGSLSHNDGTSLSLSGQYSGAQANVVGSFSRSSNYHQAGLGASGSVVVHPGGFTFSQPIGDTVGLIYAPGATGARVEGSVNSRVDSNGYAVLPYLQAYQLNTVGLDPKGTASNVELKSTTQSVAPRLGEVVRLHYDVDTSRMLIIDAKLADGRSIPFGSQVLDSKGNEVGVAGQAGRLVVRGVEESGTLTIRWGSGENERCRLPITLPSLVKGAPADTQILQAACTGGAASLDRDAIDGAHGNP